MKLPFRLGQKNEKLSQKKILIFDNDGVFTPETVRFHQEMLNEFGCNITWAEHYDILRGNWHNNESRSSIAALQNVDWKGYIDFIIPEYSVIAISKEVKEVIKGLSSKYILTIVSSGSERAMNPYLKHNDIEHYFSEVMGKEAGLSKSEKMKRIMEKYQVEPEQCICITDTLGDILEAREASIDSIALTWGAHTKQDLKKGNPVAILKNFLGLKKIL